MHGVRYREPKDKKRRFAEANLFWARGLSQSLGKRDGVAANPDWASKSCVPYALASQGGDAGNLYCSSGRARPRLFPPTPNVQRGSSRFGRRYALLLTGFSRRKGPSVSLAHKGLFKQSVWQLLLDGWAAAKEGSSRVTSGRLAPPLVRTLPLRMIGTWEAAVGVLSLGFYRCPVNPELLGSL